jgi:hypothetical protein
MLATAQDTSALTALGEAVLQAFRLISNDAAGKLGERPTGVDSLLAENARAKLREIFGENRSALIALKREPTIALAGVYKITASFWASCSCGMFCR